MTPPSGNRAIEACDVSIVIPCLNEEETIGEVIEQLARRFPEAELLVVDDGSSDGTARRAGDRPQVRLLRHPRNRGYGAAIRTACEAATRPYVVWFDADGQHGAEMVAALLARLPQCDCVIGARTGKSPAPWFRRSGVAAICWLARLLTLRSIPDLNCGLRAFRLDLLRRYLHLLPEGFSASATTTLVMLECGHRVLWTPIPTLARSGSSHLRVFRDGTRHAAAGGAAGRPLEPLEDLPSPGGGAIASRPAGRKRLVDAGRRAGLVAGDRCPRSQPAMAAAAGSVASAIFTPKRRVSEPNRACRSERGLRIASDSVVGPCNFSPGTSQRSNVGPRSSTGPKGEPFKLGTSNLRPSSRPGHLGDLQMDRVVLLGSRRLRAERSDRPARRWTRSRSPRAKTIPTARNRSLRPCLPSSVSRPTGSAEGPKSSGRAG